MSAPVKKYAIYPGWIHSRHDGDRHYINADQLMRLHGVHPDECVVVSADEDFQSRKGMGLIQLGPQHEYERRDR